MKILYSLVAFLLAFGAFAQEQNIVELAGSEEALGALSTFLGVAGLEGSLSGRGPFTVFAPTDEAFQLLPPATLNYLEQNPRELERLLAYHIIADAEIWSSSIRSFQSAGTVQGQPVRFSVFWRFDWRSFRFIRSVFVNDAMVTAADVDASNGVVHVINRVLVPPDIPKDIVSTAVETPELVTLSLLLARANLVDVLKGIGPFTLMAPTNEAFLALDPRLLAYLLANVDKLSEILLYHVIPEQLTATTLFSLGTTEKSTAFGSTTMKINADERANLVIMNEGEATVTMADKIATNGVIHIIDSVLIPPNYVLPSFQEAPATESVVVPPEEDDEDDEDCYFLCEYWWN